MAYPMMIGIFSLGVLLALVAFLIPVFEKVFKEFGGELPTITQITVGMSHFVTGRWYLLMFGTAGVVFGFRQWKNSSWGTAAMGCVQAARSRRRSAT